MAATMPLRQFGKSGEQVSAIGYGAMGLAAFYPPRVTQEQADIVLSKALESGCNFWDTAGQS